MNKLKPLAGKENQIEGEYMPPPPPPYETSLRSAIIHTTSLSTSIRPEIKKTHESVSINVDKILLETISQSKPNKVNPSAVITKEPVQNEAVKDSDENDDWTLMKFCTPDKDGCTEGCCCCLLTRFLMIIGCITLSPIACVLFLLVGFCKAQIDKTGGSRPIANS